MATSLDSPEAVGIRGLRFRHYTGREDLPSMLAIGNAARIASGLKEIPTLEGITSTYEHLTNCDPLRDVTIGELDGRPVAYGRTWWADRNSGERAFEGLCFIHPDVQRRGIGRALLTIEDRRRIELARSMTADLSERPAVLTAYLAGDEIAARPMLEAAGYRLARRHAEMTRPGLDSIPDLPFPDGIELRRVLPGDVPAMRRAFEVDAEVFRDHWGDVDDSETAWQSWLTDPDIQPELWVVAVDASTGETAGQILGYVSAGPDGRRIGWTESIAVRRPWRRRGLASAMLAESLRRVRDAGAAYAALGVDLENENRASAIYERLGFEVEVEQLEFHRRLEPAELAGPEPVR